jgi:ABC-type phosphate/phosphonate transport system substrate-binding protein
MTTTLLKANELTAEAMLDRQEKEFIGKLNQDQIELLSNILLKCAKAENHKCIEAVMSHKRFYTNTLEEIVRTIRERYE